MSGKGTTLKGITVEIGGDTTKLGDAILKARKSASALSGELRGVESLLKLDPTNTVLLAQKLYLALLRVAHYGICRNIFACNIFFQCLHN